MIVDLTHKEKGQYTGQPVMMVDGKWKNYGVPITGIIEINSIDADTAQRVHVFQEQGVWMMSVPQ